MKEVHNMLNDRVRLDLGDKEESMCPFFFNEVIETVNHVFTHCLEIME